MAARKAGLGKGLESLIPVDRPARGYPSIPLEQVSPNPDQPRRNFDDAALDGLAASIREVGVLQPVVVAETADGYVLVAGERRWRAARMAGLLEIPAVVRDAQESGTLSEALIENVQREDLTALEEAAGYQQLLDDYGMTHDEIGARVGKSRASVTNALRLLTLPPAVQGMLERRELAAGAARALAGLEDEAYAVYIAERAVDDGWSVRQVEDAVRNRLGESAPAASARSRAERPAPVIELETRLAEHLDAPVKIDYGSRGGKVVVRFRDLDALESIYRRMFGS
ncbi:MAG: ParB/RepB/Spo0J family partition protein [Acidimicrobiia bacterium]|nr:ParB/RepB/Spo0J family partition protein [Acidimicrobiia bacterium]